MRERAARTIVDDDRWPELLAQARRARNARDRVGGAAGRLRNDEADRVVGIVRRRSGGHGGGESEWD